MIEIISKGRVIKRYRSKTWFKRWIKNRIKQAHGVEISDTARDIIGILSFSNDVGFGEQEQPFLQALTFRWIAK